MSLTILLWVSVTIHGRLDGVSIEILGAIGCLAVHAIDTSGAFHVDRDHLLILRVLICRVWAHDGF